MAIAISTATVAGKDSFEHRGGDAIRRRVLDRGQRQHQQVDHVGQQIQQHHRRAADGHRLRKVFLRIAHFAGDEGHVMPRVGRKQRAGLRHADGNDESEYGARGDAQRRIERAQGEGCVKLVWIASALRPRNTPARISAAIAETFAVVKMFCTILPYSNAARVGPGEQHDHRDADQLRGRKRKRIAGGDVNRAESGSCSPKSDGTRTDKNRANATATAAMVPVWITANRVQP